MSQRPLRKRLEEASKKTGRRLDILQQDYILSWMLVAIYRHPLLKSSLVFKGGTALKKCYFGEYRFSEDLDFSAKAGLPSRDDLFIAVTEAVQAGETYLQDYAPVRLFVSVYEENEPHPQGQEAFTIRAQFPWQREPLTVVMIEISRDEHMVRPCVTRPLLHGYDEPIQQDIIVYSLEEIVLEKLRAILQHTKKLHERDWNRSRARDYYDLWRILNVFQDDLNLENFPEQLQSKCSQKQVSFDGVGSFFNDKMLLNVKRTWQQWLGPLVPNLPPYETVMEEVYAQISDLLKEEKPRA